MLVLVRKIKYRSITPKKKVFLVSELFESSQLHRPVKKREFWNSTLTTLIIALSIQNVILQFARYSGRGASTFEARWGRKWETQEGVNRHQWNMTFQRRCRCNKKNIQFTLCPMFTLPFFFIWVRASSIKAVIWSHTLWQSRRMLSISPRVWESSKWILRERSVRKNSGLSNGPSRWAYIYILR